MRDYLNQLANRHEIVKKLGGCNTGVMRYKQQIQGQLSETIIRS